MYLPEELKVGGGIVEVRAGDIDGVWGILIAFERKKPRGLRNIVLCTTGGSVYNDLYSGKVPSYSCHWKLWKERG